MNRRELAKKGFLGLCGAALGLLPKKEPDTAMVQLTVDTESNAMHYYRAAAHRAGSTYIPPGWDFLDDPVDDEAYSRRRRLGFG